MKRLGYLSVLLICLFAIGVRSQSLKNGDEFPIELLTSGAENASATIVAFVPSLTYDCDYASMLTQSFYYYFDRGLAFEGTPTVPRTRVIIVVNDRQDDNKSKQNILGDSTVVYDTTGTLFTAIGVKLPTDKSSDSTVFLLDKNNNIRLIDEAYRAQGEHLKPLERAVKALNGIELKLPKASTRMLRVGDVAPDFQINPNERLSDLRGSVVLLTFYPAAFSGTLPSPRFEITGSLTGLTFSDTELMSCSTQIWSLDQEGKGGKSLPRRIAITSSTPELLERWRQLLATNGIEYANDPDYSVSAQYFAIDPRGFNKRVSVIVDKKGRIAYVDTDYTFADTDAIEKKIEELDKK